MDPFAHQPTGTFLDSKYFDPEFLFSHVSVWAQNVFYFLFYSETFKFILTILAIFFLSILGYTGVRLLEIRTKEKRHVRHEIEEYAHHMAEKEKKRASGEGVSKNELWNNVLSHLFSNSEADWKLAVLEADVMLETLMEQLGFKGQNLGDKLKVADRDKFPQLTAAWEVHNIRNNIAHQGPDFGLSQHEAKRVVAIYEQIFRDFGYI